MSKIFEAVSRSHNTMAQTLLEPLLEGQPEADYKDDNRPAVEPVEPAYQAEVTLESIPAEAAPDSQTLAVVHTAALRVAPSSPILPFDGTHWQAGEQYRILRTKIIQHPKQPRMIVVSSAGPNDGKTVTVINLAGALALKSEARVLILDGDFRRSTICTKLGLPETLGLANVLNGECSLADAIIQAEQIPNLYILPAGKSLVNPAELLESSRWASLCATCRTNFEYIVVDSPPLGAVADYDIIQATCDGVVLVVRPDHTAREHCMQTLQIIPR